MASPSQALTSWLLSAAYTGGTLCVGALFLLYMYQDRLLYFPTIPGASKFTKDNPPGYRHPGEFSIEYEDLMIPCKDGVKINAWLMKQKEHSTRPTLIFFHGNAGNIGYRLPNAVQLFRKVGANILLVDYRGFGHSEGTPSEEGIKLDAEAVLDAMYARTDIDSSNLVAFGRSLGGAVSVYLAEKEPSRVAAVVLENTFLSISAMVDALMPFLTYVKPLVLRMDWDNERAIQKLKQPILFIAGMQDELVPHSHMEKLRSLATSSQRVVWFPVPGGTHNDSWLRGGDKYYSELRQFLEALGVDTTCLTSDGSSDEDVVPPVEENAIPNMLQQPLLSSLMRPKSE
ncbi:alpha/beta hydrolase fold [Phytophthora infestans]|uniref:Alpha/beta hydrolase fold n=1 Tax=Phytophthora infestans TaxID=4787 RepID=A0A833WDR3_PHYIN|nr:alpha/beta hydrolase fold [Phytophthora infestans]KAF4128312.1 alpha/beta hydrolase fold [Phytophthora infestans]